MRWHRFPHPWSTPTKEQITRPAPSVIARHDVLFARWSSVPSPNPVLSSPGVNFPRSKSPTHSLFCFSRPLCWGGIDARLSGLTIRVPKRWRLNLGMTEGSSYFWLLAYDCRTKDCVALGYATLRDLAWPIDSLRSGWWCFMIDLNFILVC